MLSRVILGRPNAVALARADNPIGLRLGFQTADMLLLMLQAGRFLGGQLAGQPARLDTDGLCGLARINAGSPWAGGGKRSGGCKQHGGKSYGLHWGNLQWSGANNLCST